MKVETMQRVLISCTGVAVDSLWIPPFQLKVGELVCLHLPTPVVAREEEGLIQALSGKRPVPGLHLAGRVEHAFPPRSSGGLFHFFRPRHPVNWLRHSGGVSRSEAEGIVARLGLRPEWRLDQLARNPKTLLGLEAAWARGAEGVVFTTVACDPSGVRAVCEAVSARLGRCAAIHLSHAFLQSGQIKRDCFPGGSCLELTRQSSSPTSLTPA
jgi:hypothetical protein